MNKIDKIKEKLVKLLRLSEDGGATEGEIRNAIAAAQRLMAEHNLSREDIDETKPDPYARVEFGKFRAFLHGAKSTAWELSLANFVVAFIGTVKVYRDRVPDFRGNVRAAMFFYGPSEDAESAAEMFSEIDEAIATMAVARYGGFARADGGVYAEGFAAGLRSKLEEEKKLLEAKAETNALMIVSNERALVLKEKASNWLASAGLQLGKGRGLAGSNGSRSAYETGKRDGQNYSITRTAPIKKLA